VISVNMMKSRFVAIAGLCLASALLSAPIQAQQLKVGTIDIQKVLGAYYKTQEAKEKLEAAQNSAYDELNQRMEARKRNMDAINKLNEEMNRPDVSAATKNQKAQERDGKIAEQQSLEREMTEFRDSRSKQLQEQQNHMVSALVEDIMKVVSDHVKTQSYDLVLDKSGRSAGLGTTILLYAKENMEFSDVVIAKLNANRPARKPAAITKPSAQPSGTNTPATTTKPGGSPSPSKKP
jgi:Skp family chaperone for outer membrane proteins